jgi:hypothetical protein
MGMGDFGKYAAPADADEFFRQDGAYVQGLARKLLGAGGNTQDAEDAAADIMERLLVAVNAEGRNALRQYDSSFVSAKTGQRVSWRAFLSGKVALYMRGKREQVSRRSGRELLLCDTVAGEGGSRWVELFGGESWDDYPSLADDQFVGRMRDYLATVPDDWDGPVSLFSLFSEIAGHLKEDGAVPPLSRLGLSRNQAGRAMRELGQAVRDGMAAPAQEKFNVEGVELTAAEVREAVELLRDAKGNHVHRPLAAHRLQLEAPKGWYHSFSRAERELYPECGMDQQTHKKPADHVKRAVIHRLERMLAEAAPGWKYEGSVLEGVDRKKGYLPAPAAPEPDLTREELLEAELWHVKGLDAAAVDTVLAAVRRLYTEP